MRDFRFDLIKDCDFSDVLVIGKGIGMVRGNGLPLHAGLRRHGKA